jgi:hypothetical protein
MLQGLEVFSPAHSKLSDSLELIHLGFLHCLFKWVTLNPLKLMQALMSLSWEDIDNTTGPAFIQLYWEFRQQFYQENPSCRPLITTTHFNPNNITSPMTQLQRTSTPTEAADSHQLMDEWANPCAMTDTRTRCPPGFPVHHDLPFDASSCIHSDILQTISAIYNEQGTNTPMPTIGNFWLDVCDPLFPVSEQEVMDFLSSRPTQGQDPARWFASLLSKWKVLQSEIKVRKLEDQYLSGLQDFSEICQMDLRLCAISQLALQRRHPPSANDMCLVKLLSRVSAEVQDTYTATLRLNKFSDSRRRYHPNSSHNSPNKPMHPAPAPTATPPTPGAPSVPELPSNPPFCAYLQVQQQPDIPPITGNNSPNQLHPHYGSSPSLQAAASATATEHSCQPSAAHQFKSSNSTLLGETPATCTSFADMCHSMEHSSAPYKKAAQPSPSLHAAPTLHMDHNMQNMILQYAKLFKDSTTLADALPPDKPTPAATPSHTVTKTATGTSPPLHNNADHNHFNNEIKLMLAQTIASNPMLRNVILNPVSLSTPANSRTTQASPSGAGASLYNNHQPKSGIG